MKVLRSKFRTSNFNPDVEGEPSNIQQDGAYSFRQCELEVLSDIHMLEMWGYPSLTAIIVGEFLFRPLKDQVSAQRVQVYYAR
jgi:hypothetical protein